MAEFELPASASFWLGFGITERSSGEDEDQSAFIMAEAGRNSLVRLPVVPDPEISNMVVQTWKWDNLLTYSYDIFFSRNLCEPREQYRS